MDEAIQKRRKNKKWIRRAFIELIAEKKTINKVTVNELAVRADITKTTFYYHYDDIYAVAEEFENELIEKLNKTIDEIAAETPTDYSEYFRKILEFIRENEESYRLAVRATDLSGFASRLKSIFSKRVTNMEKEFGFSPDYEKRNVQVYFLVSACVDTVMHYLKGNMASSIDTVGEVITEIVEKLKRNS